MIDQKHKSRNQWLWSAGLLLAGVAALLGGGLGPGWNGALPFVATILVLASAAAAIRAAASSSHSLNGGKRKVLLWASSALALDLALVVLTVGLETLTFTRPFVSPLCEGPAGAYSSEGCGYFYAYIFIGILGILAIAATIALLGTIIAGLTNAARRGERWWLVAILATLFGAIAVIAWSVLALQRPQLEGYAPIESVQGWLIPLTSFLLATLVLLFSLSGARQPARS